MLRVTVHDSITQIDAAEWDAILAPDRTFFSHFFLKLVEETGLNDCRFHYLVFRSEAGELVAHTLAYTMSTDLLIFSQGLLRRFTDLVRRVFPGYLRPRILECGCPVGLGQPLNLRAGVRLEDLVEPLARAMEQIAVAEGIRLLVVRDFPDPARAAFGGLAAHGYHLIDNLPDTAMEVPWPSFEGYLDSMRSRYRTKLRRRLRMAEAAGLEVAVCRDFGPLAETLFLQWSQVHEGAKEYSREQICPDFYRGMAADPRGRFRVLLVSREDELVAHGVVLGDGDVLKWLWFGRGEAHAKDAAYFLVAARVIQLAIEEGFRSIEMGVTTYTAKTEIGARMVPLAMFLRLRPNLLGGFFAALHGIFNQVPECKQIPVFSEPGESDG